jgi:hypothetical protein
MLDAGGRTRSWWLVLVPGLLAACATAEPQAIVPLPPPPKAAAPAGARLAWFPLDARGWPELASTVNERLAHAEIPGAAESFQAAVSMEMAQLAIECIERTPACWTAVGRSVGADRLLWAESQRAGHRSVTVRIVLFDVAAGAVIQKAERGFTSLRSARAGTPGLLEEALGARAETAP